MGVGGRGRGGVGGRGRGIGEAATSSAMTRRTLVGSGGDELLSKVIARNSIHITTCGCVAEAERSVAAA